MFKLRHKGKEITCHFFRAYDNINLFLCKVAQLSNRRIRREINVRVNRKRFLNDEFNKFVVVFFSVIFKRQ